MLTIPTRVELQAAPLQTERACLAPIDVADAPELWEIIRSSRSWLQPWLPWVPYQRNAESAVRFTEASAREWDQGIALRFGIRFKAGGPLLGIVGLESCVPMHRACDLGYWLRQEAAKQGLMTETARKCVDFGFRTVGIHRLRVAAATSNTPSLKVIERLGFRYEGTARHAEWCDGRWHDHAVFSLLEHEWPTPK